jgi:hypothetical protein
MNRLRANIASRKAGPEDLRILVARAGRGSLLEASNPNEERITSLPVGEVGRYLFIEGD